MGSRFEPTTATAKQQMNPPQTRASLKAAVLDTAGVLTSASTAPISGSETATVQPLDNSIQNDPKFTILPQKSSSPLQMNSAAAPVASLPIATPLGYAMEVDEPCTQVTDIADKNLREAELVNKSSSAPVTQTLVVEIRTSEDRTLKRLAPVSTSQSSCPRVIITDSVFQIGAELHKDFIICYFNGRAPSFNQIQSVFNHMWGKGNAWRFTTIL
ncbi:hypothetical protein Bca4012_030572 [Brassica carinata]|uniref:DUF4283 domain-containing protein n=1 Tax=Brassica oleracea TaxID=3712 RepID=A0A3P6C689_BRAOL|nr:unnamed protein product [Brassica oleracea]